MPAKIVETAQTFNSFDPNTNALLATYLIIGEEEVRRSVTASRSASQPWQALGYQGRKKILLAWAKVLVDRIEECGELIYKRLANPPAMRD